MAFGLIFCQKMKMVKIIHFLFSSKNSAFSGFAFYKTWTKNQKASFKLISYLKWLDLFSFRTTRAESGVKNWYSICQLTDLQTSQITLSSWSSWTSLFLRVMFIFSQHCFSKSSMPRSISSSDMVVAPIRHLSPLTADSHLN